MRTEQNRTEQNSSYSNFIITVLVLLSMNLHAQPNYFSYGINPELQTYSKKTAPQMAFTNIANKGDCACFIMQADDGHTYFPTLGKFLHHNTLICPDFRNGAYYIGSAHTYVTGDLFSEPIGIVEHGQIAYVLSYINEEPPYFVFPFRYQLSAIDLNTMTFIDSKGIEIPGDITAASIAFDHALNEVIVVFSIDGVVSSTNIIDRPGIEILRFDPSSLTLIDYARLTEDLNFFYNTSGLFRYHIEKFKLSDVSLNYNGALGSTTIGITGEYEHKVSSNDKFLSFFVGIDLATFNIVGDFWEFDFSSLSSDKYQRIAYDQSSAGSERYFYTVNSGNNQERVIFGYIDLFGSNLLSRFVQTPLGDPYYASSLYYNVHSSRVELFGEAISNTGETYNKFGILDPFNPVTTFYDLDLGDGINEAAADYLFNPNNNQYAFLSLNHGLDYSKLQDLGPGCFNVNTYNFAQSNTSPIENVVNFDVTIPGFSILHQGIGSYAHVPERFDCNHVPIIPAEVSTATKDFFDAVAAKENDYQFIDLFDITGKLIQEKVRIQTSILQNNFSHFNLSSGIYLVKLYNTSNETPKFKKIFLSN